MTFKMTANDKREKDTMIAYFIRNGFLPYAEALASTEKFITMYKDPTLTGFMSPNESLIVVNGNIDLPHRSLIVRHEILHSVLEHENRLLRELAKREGLDYDKILKSKPADLEKTLDKVIDDKIDNADTPQEQSEYEKLQDMLHSNAVSNYAGDYDISNQGYTMEDLDLVRSLVVNGELVGGLLTCDDHPEWVDYSLEQIYNELMKDFEKNPQNYPPQQGGQGGGGGQGGQGGQGGNGGGQQPNVTIIKGRLGKDGKFYNEKGGLIRGK